MSGDRVVDEVKRVFDDVGAVAERLQASGLAKAERPQAGGLATFAPSAVDRDAEDLVVAATRRERERVVSDGIDGLAKVAEGREDDLNADERFGIEAIVLLEGRPAILIQDGDFFRRRTSGRGSPTPARGSATRSPPPGGSRSRATSISIGSGRRPWSHRRRS